MEYYADCFVNWLLTVMGLLFILVMIIIIMTIKLITFLVILGIISILFGPPLLCAYYKKYQRDKKWNKK